MDRYERVEALVDELIAQRGRALSVALPIGVGKAAAVIHELVARAQAGELERLQISTALSLQPPEPSSELEARLMEPIIERLYGDVPELSYVGLRARGELPEGVEVREFYYPPGSLLGNTYAQRHYSSVNFTQALDVLGRFDPDLIAQEITSDPEGGWDLGSNPALTRQLIEDVERRGGARPLMVAQVNPRMPGLGGGARIGADEIDMLLEPESGGHEIFGAPSLAPEDAQVAIGLRAASLLRDGGTLQVGIGQLGEAICGGARLRHERPGVFARALEALGPGPSEPEIVDREGGRGPFEIGLYSSTELLSDGLMGLFECGVLGRQVVGDVALERARQALGRGGVGVDLALVDELVAQGALEARPGPEQVAWMVRWGILRPGTEWVGQGQLRLGQTEVAADLEDEVTRQALERELLGERLRGGRSVQAAFYLGSPAFYERLRGLDERERERVEMTDVFTTNRLLGGEELRRVQRRHARFINQAMMVTLMGAAVSDGLEDGRVVSGVGGQFEFVQMGHQLEGGRSVLALPATRISGGEVRSNIVWSYGHVTIPRHLRDVVVTEYGIADLRGRTDEEVIAAMIEIADARFQPRLIEQARRAGKLDPSYEPPTRARDNTPGAIEDALAPHRASGAIPRCPFGSDLTEVELDLVEGLEEAKRLLGELSARRLPSVQGSGLWSALSSPDAARPHLERMGLAEPSSPRELGMQRLVLYALGAAGRA